MATTRTRPGARRLGSGALLAVLALLAACASNDTPDDEPAGSCRPDGESTPAPPSSGEGGATNDAPEPDPVCDDQPWLHHGPLLGAVTDRSVKVWAKADQPGAFHVLIWREDTPAEVRTLEGPRFETATEHTAVALVDGLEPDTRYGYQVRHDECACPTRYTFRTLPARGEPARIRFAAGADVEGSDVPGFAEIAAVDPAFVLMLGDNTYADGFGKEADIYRMRYEQVWSGLQFGELFARHPAFMMWDDHELVDNYWQGKNDAVYAFARPLYDEYQGSHNPDPLVDGALYYTFEAADVGFFVLDTRSHRSPNKDPDVPGKTMLGAEQKAQLLAWLAANRHRVHVIVSSVLLSDFSTTGEDSWSGFTSEREELLEAIAAAGTSHTFAISGDQHWSAILRLDRGEPLYSIYEFQPTPLGKPERVAPLEADERVLALDNTHHVYAVFDVDTTRDPPTLDYTLCAVGAPCRPHEESGPSTIGSVTSVPYTVGFEGRPQGFEIVSGM